MIKEKDIGKLRSRAVAERKKFNYKSQLPYKFAQYCGVEKNDKPRK